MCLLVKVSSDTKFPFAFFEDVHGSNPDGTGIMYVQDGVLISKKSLTIDDTGDVNATVTTEGLAVSGRLNGHVEASARVEIKKEGTLIGDIKAPRVVIADGAKFKGRVDMGVD